ACGEARAAVQGHALERRGFSPATKRVPTPPKGCSEWVGSAEMKPRRSDAAIDEHSAITASTCDGRRNDFRLHTPSFTLSRWTCRNRRSWFLTVRRNWYIT